jgi:hypothetical protein
MQLGARFNLLGDVAGRAARAHCDQTMNTRRCLKIASRMNTLLMRELGQGLDPQRMLADPRYARDVLLVCDAMRDHELATLSPRFRRAALAEADDPHALRGRSGFSASRFLGSLFGTPSTLDNPAPVPPASGGWFSRSRSAQK